MAEDKSKDSKDSKDTKAKEEETWVTGTGREAFPHESDPKLAAEATTVVAAPVEGKEAQPGQPVVDPNPAYDPEAEAKAEAEAAKADDKK